MKTSASSRARLSILLAMLIWGSIGLFRRFIPLPSASLAAVRALGGVACLLLCAQAVEGELGARMRHFCENMDLGALYDEKQNLFVYNDSYYRCRYEIYAYHNHTANGGGQLGVATKYDMNS